MVLLAGLAGATVGLAMVFVAGFAAGRLIKREIGAATGLRGTAETGFVTIGLVTGLVAGLAIGLGAGLATGLATGFATGLETGVLATMWLLARRGAKSIIIPRLTGLAAGFCGARGAGDGFGSAFG